MRKAFSLVECVTIIAVIAVISIPLSRLFKVMIYDIPKSCKLVESNTSILDVLKHIRKDINSAKGFPQSFQEYSTDANSLLIEQQGSVICYLLQDGKISRIVIGDAKEKITWQIPNGKIEWRVWRKNGEGFAVEVKKCVELKSYNRADKKMENAYVYFAGAYKEAKN
ncbi:MAG: hypothetical protein NTW93_08620 [Phycisphaerae bacterium]|nr:hypothetical protein [Phycisphaerae bacterium]